MKTDRAYFYFQEIIKLCKNKDENTTTTTHVFYLYVYKEHSELSNLMRWPWDALQEIIWREEKNDFIFAMC